MNPRLPTELKAMRGTLNTTREKQNPSAEVLIEKSDIIYPKGTVLSCPKKITDRYCRRYWKTLTKNLIAMRVLSEDDLPQVENLILTLQKLREVQEEFAICDVMDPDFDNVERRFTRLSNKFDTLAAKYYISPQARTQLKLQDLSLLKTEQEITKNQSAIGSLLQGRQN